MGNTQAKGMKEMVDRWVAGKDILKLDAVKKYLEVGPQAEALKEMEEKGCPTVYERGDLAFRCAECARQENSVLCVRCFDPAKHVGHNVKIIKTSGGTCDCGHPGFWDEKTFCREHSGPGLDEEAILRNLPAEIKTVFIPNVEILIDGALAYVERNRGARMTPLILLAPVANEWGPVYKKVLADILDERRTRAFIRLEPFILGCDMDDLVLIFNGLSIIPSFRKRFSRILGEELRYLGLKYIEKHPDSEDASFNTETFLEMRFGIFGDTCDINVFESALDVLTLGEANYDKNNRLCWDSECCRDSKCFLGTSTIICCTSEKIVKEFVAAPRLTDKLFTFLLPLEWCHTVLRKEGDMIEHENIGMVRMYDFTREVLRGLGPMMKKTENILKTGDAQFLASTVQMLSRGFSKLLNGVTFPKTAVEGVEMVDFDLWAQPVSIFAPFSNFLLNVLSSVLDAGANIDDVLMGIDKELFFEYILEASLRFFAVVFQSAFGIWVRNGRYFEASCSYFLEEAYPNVLKSFIFALRLCAAHMDTEKFMMTFFERMKVFVILDRPEFLGMVASFLVYLLTSKSFSPRMFALNALACETTDVGKLSDVLGSTIAGDPEFDRSLGEVAVSHGKLLKLKDDMWKEVNPGFINVFLPTFKGSFLSSYEAYAKEKNLKKYIFVEDIADEQFARILQSKLVYKFLAFATAFSGMSAASKMIVLNLLHLTRNVVPEPEELKKQLERFADPSVYGGEGSTKKDKREKAKERQRRMMEAMKKKKLAMEDDVESESEKEEETEEVCAICRDGGKLYRMGYLGETTVVPMVIGKPRGTVYKTFRSCQHRVHKKCVTEFWQGKHICPACTQKSNVLLTEFAEIRQIPERIITMVSIFEIECREPDVYGRDHLKSMFETLKRDVKYLLRLEKDSGRDRTPYDKSPLAVLINDTVVNKWSWIAQQVPTDRSAYAFAALFNESLDYTKLFGGPERPFQLASMPEELIDYLVSKEFAGSDDQLSFNKCMICGEVRFNSEAHECKPFLEFYPASGRLYNDNERTVSHALYVDKFGQPDYKYKRGNPLYLNHEGIKALKRAVLEDQTSTLDL